MTHQVPRLVLICCWVVLCGSCRGSDTEGSAARPASAEPQVAVSSSETLAPGTHCFRHEDETLKLSVQLVVDDSDRVTGIQTGLIEDPKESYYSSYESSISGVRAANTLTLTILTAIEDDTLAEQATWTWEDRTLDDGAHLLVAEDCPVG